MSKFMSKSILPTGRIAGIPHDRSRRVLVMLNWYSTKVHLGIARYADEAHWAVDLSVLHEPLAPQSWRGDGVVCISTTMKPLSRRILSYGVPIVNIGHDDRLPTPRITTDAEKVMRMAVDHFTQRGFENQAFYMRFGSKGELTKMRWFKRAAEGAGKTFHLIDLSGHTDTQSKRGESNTIQLLGKQIAKLPKPLAVTAEIDSYAIDVINASLKAGFRVPDQVAVLGINDDQSICPFAAVPLSSIDDNLEEIGYRAATLLDRLMRGGKPPAEPILVPPLHVTTRQSTDGMVISNPDVMAAMRIIEKRFREHITTQTLANDIHSSRRQLHDLFMHYIGRSVSREILQRRMEYATRLLAESDMKLQNIAWNSGFSSAASMVRLFRKIKGTTPGKLRREFSSHRRSNVAAHSQD